MTNATQGQGMNIPNIWLCDLTYTQQTVASDTMPMAIAGIATYLEANVPWLEEVNIFKYPEKLFARFNDGEYPNLIGFSNYIWNFRLGYKICKYLKRVSPTTVIVFGGPNYPVVGWEQEEFLLDHPLIDFYILKEGEKAAVNLVSALYANEFNVAETKKVELKSVHWVNEEELLVGSTEQNRIRDLSEIPSPYLSGKMTEFFDGSLMPLIQTNRGCPFKCTFCVEGDDYYNKINRSGREKISSEIEFIGKTMAATGKNGGRNDLFIADSNFGMYSEDIETCTDLAESREKYGWPEYIHVATGKNQKERVLKAASIIDGALRLSGSVQSLNPAVQENIKRKNISADGLIDLALSAQKINANSYSEIILGLPGESKSSHFETVKKIINAGFNNIYLFQLMMLPGSELANQGTITKYGMNIRYRILPRCFGRYPLREGNIGSAEIEAICVATDTLSYNDYLACRFMHLVVTIFYNDCLYGTLLQLIKMHGLSPWDWIEVLMSLKVGTDLDRLYSQFRAATENELWSDRNELEKFVEKPGVIEKYLSGELGNNLLFVHKSRALTECLDDLTDLASRATQELFRRHNLLDSSMLRFIEDCARYHDLRMRDLFLNLNKTYAEQFDYDIASFEGKQTESKNPADYMSASTITLKFAFNSEQKDIIERYLKTFGTTPVGLGRILSRVYIRKLFRVVVTGTEELTEKKPLEKEFVISGLRD